MKHKASIGFRLLATALVFLAACTPVRSLEGVTLKIPMDGAPAWQIKSDRSGHDNCRIGGGQQAKVTGETFWSPNTGGSGDNISTDLVEVDVENPGSCDRIRPIFLTKTDASNLESEASSQSPEGTPNPFIPFSATPGSTK